MTTRRIFRISRGETVRLERAARKEPERADVSPSAPPVPRGVLFTEDEEGRYLRRAGDVTFEFYDLGTRYNSTSGRYEFLEFAPYVHIPYPDTSPQHQEEVRWSSETAFLLQGDPFGSTPNSDGEKTRKPNCARLPEDSDYLFIDCYLYRAGSIYQDDESTIKAVTVLGTGNKRPVLWVADRSTIVITGAPAPRSKSWTGKAQMKRARGNRDKFEVDAWWYYNGLSLNLGKAQDPLFKLTNEPNIEAEEVELRLKPKAEVRVYLTPRVNIFRVFTVSPVFAPMIKSVVDRVRVTPDSDAARTPLALNPDFDMDDYLAEPRGDLLDTLVSYFAPAYGASFYGFASYSRDTELETRFPQQLVACFAAGEKIYYFWELSGERSYTIGEFFYARPENSG
ncbi:MAG: hypothetical protein MSG64_16630 [Pyrinomonadaceae bacterium MAG19_C2-C3]|nr:hypothetical protein [Pyrinomonadaceae bacterium MAG19_C2-C3]